MMGETSHLVTNLLGHSIQKVLYECESQFLRTINFTTYFVSGIQSVSEHKLLPNHDAQLVTNVKEILRLIDASSPETDE